MPTATPTAQPISMAPFFPDFPSGLLELTGVEDARIVGPIKADVISTELRVLDFCVDWLTALDALVDSLACTEVAPGTVAVGAAV